jgi:exopolysaccharide biosynthesis WecB/TagA/CpsF family protein
LTYDKEKSLEFLNQGNFPSVRNLHKTSRLSKKSVHFTALHTIVEALISVHVHNALKGNLLVRDSNYIPKFLQSQLGESIFFRGHDFLEFSLRNSEPTELHFFLGGTDVSHNRLRHRISKYHLNFHLVGTYSGAVEINNEANFELILKEIENTKANVVWVFLGSPKQDVISNKLAGKIDASIIACGAAIDFSAGTIKPAPKLVRKLKIEWVYRLYFQPLKIFKRHTKSIVIIAREYLRQKFL